MMLIYDDASNFGESFEENLIKQLELERSNIRCSGDDPTLLPKIRPEENFDYNIPQNKYFANFLIDSENVDSSEFALDQQFTYDDTNNKHLPDLLVNSAYFPHRTVRNGLEPRQSIWQPDSISYSNLFFPGAEFYNNVYGRDNNNNGRDLQATFNSDGHSGVDHTSHDFDDFRGHPKRVYDNSYGVDNNFGAIRDCSDSRVVRRSNDFRSQFGVVFECDNSRFDDFYSDLDNNSIGTSVCSNSKVDDSACSVELRSLPCSINGRSNYNNQLDLVKRNALLNKNNSNCMEIKVETVKNNEEYKLNNSSSDSMYVNCSNNLQQDDVDIINECDNIDANSSSVNYFDNNINTHYVHVLGRDSFGLTRSFRSIRDQKYVPSDVFLESVEADENVTLYNFVERLLKFEGSNFCNESKKSTEDKPTCLIQRNDALLCNEDYTNSNSRVITPKPLYQSNSTTPRKFNKIIPDSKLKYNSLNRDDSGYESEKLSFCCVVSKMQLILDLQSNLRGN